MNSRSGFTIVELLIAITVLTVGLLSFLGASAMITRMLARGDRAATATFYAQERLEQLQGQPCGTIASGTQTRGAGYQVAWGVTPSVTGGSQRVQILIRYAAGPGSVRVDTLETSVLCIR